MNCPRCTHEIPEGSRYCPACGLDLESLSEEAADDLATEVAPAEGEAAATEDAGAGREESGPLWPEQLRVQPTKTPKRPMLAATLAFFFGPFSYLYVEQTHWFWWGFLGGIILIILSRGELIPLLVIGYILHAYDLAVIVNEKIEGGNEPTVELEGEQA